MKSGEDEDYIEQILKSERVSKLFDKMELTRPFERCGPKNIGTRVDPQQKPQMKRSVVLSEGTLIHGAGEPLATDNAPKEQSDVVTPMSSLSITAESATTATLQHSTPLAESPKVTPKFPQASAPHTTYYRSPDKGSASPTTKVAQDEAAQTPELLPISTPAIRLSDPDLESTDTSAKANYEELTGPSKSLTAPIHTTESAKEMNHLEETCPTAKVHINEVIRAACKILLLKENQTDPESKELLEDAQKYIDSCGKNDRSIKSYMQHARKWVTIYRQNPNEKKIVRELKSAFDNFSARESIVQGESLPATTSATKAPREESKREKPTKGDIPGYQAAVHYECLVLHKLRELTLDASNPSPYPYVAVSRLCCFYCGSFFEFFNKYAGETKFYVKGCHQKVYDRITAPMLTPELDRRIETQMIERLRCEIVRQLGLPGEERIRSLSESSVEEDWGRCDYPGGPIPEYAVEDDDEEL